MEAMGSRTVQVRLPPSKILDPPLYCASPFTSTYSVERWSLPWETTPVSLSWTLLAPSHSRDKQCTNLTKSKPNIIFIHFSSNLVFITACLCQTWFVHKTRLPYIFSTSEWPGHSNNIIWTPAYFKWVACLSGCASLCSHKSRLFCGVSTIGLKRFNRSTKLHNT